MRQILERTSRCRLVQFCLAVTFISILNAPPLPAQSQFAGVNLNIPNETVPAGGMLQMKVRLTEPKPILKGGQATRFSTSVLGAPVGIHLFSPAGDASGVAVVSPGSVQFFFNSPKTSLGTAPGPLFTITLPVSDTATVGQQVNLTLDTANSNWFDPSSETYPVKLKSGVLTVGGTLSISNIAPGSGVVPAGRTISIEGTGFQPTSVVQINGAKIAASQFLNPNLIQITLKADTDMEGRRVQVTDRTTSKTTTYYSYQRTAALGSSTRALVAASYALFSRSVWNLAYFKPVVGGSVFSALALQNTSGDSFIVRLELHSSDGTLLASQFVPLTANSHTTRDLKEFFPAATAATGTEVKILSGIPIQVLGMIGDDASGVVLPVEPSPVP